MKYNLLQRSVLYTRGEDEPALYAPLCTPYSCAVCIVIDFAFTFTFAITVATMACTHPTPYRHPFIHTLTHTSHTLVDTPVVTGNRQIRRQPRPRIRPHRPVPVCSARGGGHKDARARAAATARTAGRCPGWYARDCGGPRREAVECVVRGAGRRVWVRAPPSRNTGYRSSCTRRFIIYSV